MKLDAKSKWFKLLVLLMVSITIVTITSIIKYPTKEVNYTNSDATFHTLLTMQAYDETPAQVHKFLPIVTLGEEGDKFIKWGLTIPDEKGNYYYTSFSPAGYMLPYFFCKLTSLPINESSLYIFNSILFAVSAFLVGLLIIKVFGDDNKIDNKSLMIGIIGIFLYIFTPETLNSMGIVYWHQSLMQVTLLIQTLAFINFYKFNDKKASFIVFLIMSFLNPYIEWTGYVANVGFAFAFLIIYRKNIKQAIIKVMQMAGITILSFVAFSLHYCSTVDFNDYVKALHDRFFARNYTNGVALSDLFKGYISSFGLLFLLIVELFIILVIVYKGFSFFKVSKLFSDKIILLVLLFPVIENFVMKQHAVAYTYDRMKLIFALLVIICDFIYLISKRISLKPVYALSWVLAVTVALGNIYFYTANISWEAPYRADNSKIAEYCINKYTEENSVYGLKSIPVRGYVNMLFERSIYEHTSYDWIVNTTGEKDKQYAVLIIAEDNVDGKNQWNMYKITSIQVFDRINNTESTIYIDNGVVKEDVIQL